MKTFIWMLALALVVLSGCQCGPGVACKDDSACAPWGTCSASGFCIAKPGPGTDGGETDGGGMMDAGSAPRITLIDAALELGDVGCGGELTGSIGIRNEGGSDLIINATSSHAGFTVTAMFTVPPATTVPLMITGRVPASAFAGQPFEGLLTIDSNDPTLRRVFAPMRMKATGVTVSATPPSISFGVAPLNVQAPDVTVQLRNTGTQTATLALGMSDDTQFEITPRSVSVDAGTTVNVTARFRPTATTLSRATVDVTPTEPVCGMPLEALALSGQGTTGLVGLSTTELFFGDNGRVACGERATAQTLTITNAGGAAFAWSGALALGPNSPFTLMPSSGTVPAMSSVMISVTTSAIPATASTAPDAFGDMLTLTTDAPNDMPHQIALHQSAHGAVLKLNPAAVQFGGVPIGTSATAPVTVVNEGSSSIGVSIAVGPGEFTLEPGAPVSATPGNQTATVRFTPSMDAGTQMGTFTLSVVPDSGVLCDVIPAAATLTGQGTTGSVGYSPVALDFGDTNCGGTAAPQVITFTNAGNLAYRVTAALGANTPKYTLSMNPSSGDVAADGGTLRITVTPLAIPQTSSVTANLYGDTLRVTTDVVGDAPHDIPLSQSARGAIFTISTPVLNFGDIAIGTVANSQFTLTNTGNAPGTLEFDPGGQLFSLPASVFVGANSSLPVSGTFSPMGMGMVTDDAFLTVPTGTVLCQPLPTPVMPAGPPRLPLAGRGVATPVLAQSTNNLTFGNAGLVPCGTQAAAKTFTLTNNSAQNLSLSYSVMGATTTYNVSGPSNVASMAQVTVTVTPQAIPTTSATTTDLYAATLTITAAGGPVMEQKTVEFHMTAQGARLSFNPTSLRNFDGQGMGTQNFTLVNDGNATATFSLSLANPNNNYSFTPAGSSTVAGSSGRVGTVSFNRGLLQLGTVTNTLSVGTSSVLCAPLPAPMTLTTAQ